tara:strand:+ start:651 stop:1022 length:372 start_codon:yes stop_codon:yes gene_type:complete
MKNNSKINLKEKMASMSMDAKATLICDPNKPSNLYRLTSLEIKGSNSDGQKASRYLDREELEAMCKELGLRTSWKSRKSVDNVMGKIEDKLQDAIQEELNRESSVAVSTLKFDTDLTLLNKNN